MKRFFLRFMACAFAISVVFSSCGDDVEIPGTEPINPVEPDEKEAMTSAQQKEYLEDIAMEFMNMIPSNDFKNIADLEDYIVETYIDDYDWDVVDEWGEGCWKAVRESLGTTDTESESYSWYGENYRYNYYYANYKALLLASNFVGRFTAKNGKWTLSKSDKLEFVFPDQNGTECIAKLETSGSVKKVYIGSFDEYDHYDSQQNGNNYVSNEYYDRVKSTIGIPENVTVTLTQGGKQVVKTTVKINLSNITDEIFDISKSGLTLSQSTELNNGYKFDVAQAAYTGNENVSTSFAMSKNGKNIVTGAVSSDISGIPSCTVDDLITDGYYEDEYNTDDATATKAYVKLDIIGKLQIQGTVANVRKFVDYLNKADDNDDDERTYKSYINQANGLCDVNLFYDGSAVKQATVKLEPFIDDTWNGRTWWSCEPVLFFYDGTSYSTFEAFFNETDFKKVIDTFKRSAEKYADLIDERIYW